MPVVLEDEPAQLRAVDLLILTRDRGQVPHLAWDGCLERRVAEADDEFPDVRNAGHQIPAVVLPVDPGVRVREEVGVVDYAVDGVVMRDGYRPVVLGTGQAGEVDVSADRVADDDLPVGTPAQPVVRRDAVEGHGGVDLLVVEAHVDQVGPAPRAHQLLDEPHRALAVVVVVRHEELILGDGEEVVRRPDQGMRDRSQVFRLVAADRVHEQLDLRRGLLLRRGSRCPLGIRYMIDGVYVHHVRL